MNILIMTDKLYPDETGGSCTYAFETSCNMYKLGNNVDIFTSYPEKINNDKYFPNIKLYRYLYKRSPVKSSKILLDIINKNKYDFIIFHSALSWFVYSLIKNKINYSIKKVGIFHGPWNKEAKLKYLYKKSYIKLLLVPAMRKIEYLYASDMDKFIFLSNYMRNELIRINPIVKNKDYNIISGGVNISNYKRLYSKKEAREKLGIDQNNFVIFSLRRLEYRMGIHNAIDAINKLELGNDKKVLYLIGGKGPYEKILKEKSKSHIDKFKFLGYIPDNKLNLYYCASDLFLVPSIDLEGFGLVILESLSMSLPVLVTPQGGMNEINGKFKYLYVTKGFEPKNIENSLKYIYNHVDLECCIEPNIKEYDWSKITKNICESIF